ncbi:beta-propeller domain-containing protein [Candidatus Pacearchaeota archaeon]|nr:beta-propeller domain-containing protein [Candidatus Pacearchaeota archaeon]
MKEEMKNIVVVGSVLVVAIVFLVVSLRINPVGPNVNVGEINNFNSVEEIRAFLEENVQENNFYYGGLASTQVMGESGAVPAVANDMAKAGVESQSASDSGADSYSQTNVQVEGVDEPDIVKNDGKYIYTVSGNKVVIVDAYPAEGMDIVSEVSFDKDSVMGLFVNEDKMIVFTQKYEYVDSGIRCGEIYWGIRCGGYSKESTLAYIYDVSDRSNPELDKTIALSGNYLDARMIGNYVYLISNKYIYENSFDLPFYEVDGVKTDIAPTDIYYFRQHDQNFVFDTIAAINVDDGEFETETYLVGSSTSIFVSEDNIYLTYQRKLSQEYIMGRYLDEILLPELPNSVAGDIEDIWGDDDKSLSEKEREIGEIFGDYMQSLDDSEVFEFQNNLEEKAFEFFKEIQEEQEKTVIHRVSVDGLGISAEAVGEVPGRVLNQFSMDEYDGTFRIATTTGGWDREENENGVYVLNLDLEIIGKLEGLAEGEQIYSARFMGGRAYMVTFRQTDPLFAIDLSNPENPRVLGELKVTGYSGYLQPYDENHLIGIGMEASESGRVEGVKISLYDVTEMKNPEEIGKYEVEEKWSNSEATYDHKAVLFDKEKNLLVIPVSYSKEYSVAGQLWPNYENWQGAYVFNVDLNGIELKGKIAHEQDEKGDQYWYGGGDYVRRSLYMDDVLYTISNSKIKANELSDLSSIGEVKLPFESYGGPIAYGGVGGGVVEPDLTMAK